MMLDPSDTHNQEAPASEPLLGRITPEEQWPQYSWRPWNGFWFAPAVVLIYFGLPALGKPVPAVPQLVWAGWLLILGVATVGRNREKAIKAGASAEGTIASAIKAIKG